MSPVYAATISNPSSILFNAFTDFLTAIKPIKAAIPVIPIILNNEVNATNIPPRRINFIPDFRMRLAFTSWNFLSSMMPIKPRTSPLVLVSPFLFVEVLVLPNNIYCKASIPFLAFLLCLPRSIRKSRAGWNTLNDIPIIAPNIMKSIAASNILGSVEIVSIIETNP